MIIAQSAVGSAVANCTPFLANYPQLADHHQLEAPLNQGIAGNTPQLAVGNAANLPTGANPRGCWTFSLPPVGENSPSYYVGEGPESPSTVREMLADYPGSDHRRPSVTSLLALDLGTRTGWALRGSDGQIISATQSFTPQRFEGGGMRYLRFKRWLTEIKQVGDGIDAVYFEEVRRHAGVDAAHAYGGFMAHLTAWCEHHQIPYLGVPVGTIKKHTTGKGNANKAQMIAAMQLRGHAPRDDNEADALALLYWVIETQECQHG